MKRKKKIHKSLSLWHGRLGLLSSIFIILLAITGILINHAHSLKLDTSYIRNNTLLALYGIKPPPLKAVKVNQHWLVWQGKDLFLGGAPLLECRGEFVGAVALNQYWVAACSEDFFIFNDEQVLVERVGTSAGINYPITKVGACEASLCYQAAKTTYKIDIETLKIAQFNRKEGHALQWSSPSAPPKTVAAVIRKQFRSDTITWERVLLDLHAGRFLGAAGKYILDAMAILFILLAISGVYFWTRRRK